MSNVLNLTYTGSNTVYSIIRSLSDLKVWNGTSFETWNNSNIATYDIPLSSAGGDLYAADFPSSITTNSIYRVLYYEQAGGSPAITDLLLATDEGIWDGTNLTSATGTIASTSSIAATSYVNLYCTIDEVKQILPPHLAEALDEVSRSLTPALTEAEIESYIIRADSDINALLQQSYVVPLRRIKMYNIISQSAAVDYKYPDPISFVSQRLAASYIYNEKYTSDGGHIDGSAYGKEYLKQAMVQIDNIRNGTIYLQGQVYRGLRYIRPESLSSVKFPGHTQKTTGFTSD